MAKHVITHEVEDVAKWQGFDAERIANMSAFATDVISFTDVNGSKSVALHMTVTDEEAMNAFMQSDFAGAVMRKHGVLEPLTVLKTAD